MPVPKVECNQNPRFCGHLFAAPPLTSYGIPLTAEQAGKGYGTLECQYGAPGSICPAVQALLAPASAVTQPVRTP